jgi:hypothetical protein
MKQFGGACGRVLIQTAKRYYAFKSICESKLLHKFLIMARYSTRSNDVIESYYYSSFKSMLRLKGKPNKQKLIQIMLMGTAKDYLNDKLDLIL